MLHWSYILILVEVFTNWWLYVLIFIPIGCKVIEKYHSKNIVVHFWFSPQIIFVFRWIQVLDLSSLWQKVKWGNGVRKNPPNSCKSSKCCSHYSWSVLKQWLGWRWKEPESCLLRGELKGKIKKSPNSCKFSKKVAHITVNQSQRIIRVEVKEPRC